MKKVFVREIGVASVLWHVGCWMENGGRAFVSVSRLRRVERDRT